MNRPRLFLTLTLIAASQGLSCGSTLAAEDRIITRMAEGNFSDVSAEIRASIEGKGISIAHVLPASDMLHRTAEA